MTQTIEAIYTDGVLKAYGRVASPGKPAFAWTVEAIDETNMDREAAEIASMRFFSGEPLPIRNYMIAVDTNVLVYACDQSEPHAQ